MAFNDNRPGLITTPIIYGPAIGGAYMSGKRALEALGGVESGSTLLVANRGIRNDAAAIAAGLSVSKISRTKSNASRLASIGINSTELDDITMQSLNTHLSKTQEGMASMYAFLNHPQVGLTPQDIAAKMNLLKEGSVSPMTLMQSELAGRPHVKDLLFDVIGQNARGASLVSQYNLSLQGGGKGSRFGKLQTVNMSDVSLHGRSQEVFDALKGFSGRGGLIRELKTFRVNVPGTVGAKGGGGYIDYAQFKTVGGSNVPVNVPLNQDTYLKFPSGRSRKVNIYHHGKHFQTMYALPDMHINVKSKDLLNYGEALMIGAEGTAVADAPLIKLLTLAKNSMDTSTQAMSARAMLRSADLFNLTSTAMNPIGKGVYIPTLRAGFTDIRSQAAMISQQIEPTWWPKIGKELNMPADRVEAMEAIYGQFNDAYIGGSPKAMGSRGIFSAGEGPYKIPFNQARRPFQPWSNPMNIDPASMVTIPSKYGPVGSTLKPFNRWVQPNLTGLGTDIAAGTTFNYYAAFMLPPAGNVGATIGEGELLVFGGDQKPWTAADKGRWVEDRVEAILGKADKTRGSYDDLERAAYRKAWRDVEYRSHLRPLGPDTRFTVEYRVAAGTDKQIAPVSSAIEDFFTKGTPQDIGPDDILGVRRTATGGAQPVFTKGGIFGKQKIVDIQAVTGSYGDEWKIIASVYAPAQEGTKVFGGHKATIRSVYADVGRKRVTDDLGIRGSVEAVAANAELTKNDYYLRTQQMGGLQGSLDRVSVNNINRKRIESNALRDNLYDYMADRGSRIKGATGLTRSEHALFGMMQATEQMKYSDVEIAEIFAAQMHYDKNVITGSAGAGVMKTLFGDRADTVVSAMESQRVVYGTLPVKPSHVPGQLTGKFGSIEPRSLQALYRSLPQDVSAPIIGDLVSRLADRDGSAYKMAYDWTSDPAGFAKGLEVQKIGRVAGDVPSTPFGKGRMAYNLPDWSVTKGNDAFRNLVLPSIDELAQFEAQIGVHSGIISSPYKKTVENMFEAISAAAGERGTRATARELVLKAFQTQQTIYSRMLTSLAKGKVIGSTYAKTAVYSKYTDFATQAKALPANTAVATDAVFDEMIGQLRGIDTDPKYIKSLQASWNEGERIPAIFGRHPTMPQHSMQLTFLQRAKGKLFAADQTQRIIYFPEQIVSLSGGTLDAPMEATISAYSGTARTADFDNDHVMISLSRDKKGASIITSYLDSNKAIYGREIADDSLARQYIGKLWKTSQKSGVSIAETAVKLMDDFVNPATALGNIQDVGLLSNVVSVLGQANLAMPTAGGGPGALGPRRMMETLLYAMEEAPISSKHTSGGESVARKISDYIHTTLAQPKESAASTAGERITNFLFGEGGIMRKDLGLDELFKEGGAMLKVTNAAGKSTALHLEVTQGILRQYAQSIDNFIESSGPEWMNMWLRKASTIETMDFSRIEEVREMLKAKASPLWIDQMGATHQLDNVLSGSSSAQLTSANWSTKLRAAGKQIGGKWFHISKPLVVGAGLTAGLYSLLSGPGYAADPITMPGEQVDPRVLHAIQSGTLLNGGSGRGDYNEENNMATINTERASRKASEMEYYANSGRASTPYSGRMYTPTARLAMPSTGRYRYNAQASSPEQAHQLAEHFQAHIPHARMTLEARNSSSGYLSSQRLENQL